MTIINVDLNDNVKVLTACRNMLNEVICDQPPVVAEKTPAKVEGKEGAQLSEEDYTHDPVEPDTVSSSSGSGNQVDMHGVSFSPDFCGISKDPFYASGKRKGRWKKRRNVADEAYDTWYASQGKSETTAAAEEDDQVSTAAAFGADDTATSQEQAPTDCGAFMGWVSAKQAAGLLTQDDIGAAHMHANVQVTDLFPPNDPATVENHVKALHTFLAAKAGA